MTAPSIQEVRASNFGCLADVRVPLSRLTVLVGPNGSGKSTLLNVIQFLGDSVRLDLSGAVGSRGGVSRLSFRGAKKPNPEISVGIKAVVTKHASASAPDEYDLWLRRLRTPPASDVGAGAREEALLARETFVFKRYRGPGRRITVKDAKVEIYDGAKGAVVRSFRLGRQTLGLATLPRLGAEQGAEQVAELASLLTSFRVFDVNVDAARRPAAIDPGRLPHLESDASNLGAFLKYLAEEEEERFSDLERDARHMIPGFKRLMLESIGGAREGVVVRIEEDWLPGATDLAAASYGTVRALALLALLHDPHPPAITCVEEIDHGLHPHVFDRLVDLLRAASERTQILIATHSPALVNRLRPSELVVCERDPATGAARIPAVDPAEVAATAGATDLGLGELWFSGVLGGGLG